MPHSYIIYNTATGSHLDYYWSFGDSTYSTLAYPTHVYAAAGYYDLCLTITDTAGNCSDTYCDTNRYFAKTASTVSIRVVNGNSSVSGITDINNAAIQIYPNPAGESVNIKIDLSQIGSPYILSDMTGRELNAGYLKQEVTNIPLHDLSSGVYLIQLGATSKHSYKIIKE